MPKIEYITVNMRDDTLRVIHQANSIIGEYQAQGFTLTLRQLYYQFVSRDLLPNTMRSYKRLGNIVNDGRLAGLIDWKAIEDRTRNVQSLGTWDSPSDILRAVAEQYRLDLWANQKYRPEVWIEKEALAGVIEGVCQELRISFFCCRGYVSQSEMWSSAMRLHQTQQRGQTPLILHFGDHDPSGIDMTRDIVDRMELFMGGPELQRMALNMDQVEKYRPPPNPAKITDSRFEGYSRQYGDESWELDALEPRVIGDLIREKVLAVRDEGFWEESLEEENDDKGKLSLAADRIDNDE